MNLDAQIANAHEHNDIAELSRLYEQGGNELRKNGEEEAGLFLLCQAYVFALESGSESVSRLHAVLQSHGRES